MLAAVISRLRRPTSPLRRQPSSLVKLANIYIKMRLISAFGVVLAITVSSEVFIDKAIFSLFLYVTFPDGLGFAYSNAQNITDEPELQTVDFGFVHGDAQNVTGEPEIPFVDIGPAYESQWKESEPPTAKIELVVMLDPDVSDHIDTAYAVVEFCRLFQEAQEIFDTMKERKVNVEFSKLYYEENATYAHYIDDNVIFEENGTIDVVGTLDDVADVVDKWDDKFDIYLLLTRRPLVAVFGNETIENLAGYSIARGACQPGKNIAIAQYSYKYIMHEITHLLGAVHANDKIPVGSTCVEGNYTNQIVDDRAYVRFVKGFANCTKDYMIDFLKGSNATCLYSEDILDYLDCDNIIPEIRVDNSPPWLDL